MADPSKISRDVKGLVADFREELKLRDPWDREIDIQFKRIQRKYKELLFDFPFARQSNSVDQALWTDTSYALITRYRSRIDPARNSSAKDKNVVENRKILQKFLAFLAAEGAFWSGIALRLVRAHGLCEANGAMTVLGMDVVEFENRESLARGRSAGTGSGGDATSPISPPQTPEHRSNKLLTLFRTLIFLGDLARYREQYGTHPNKSNTENGRRPRGGRRGKDKSGDGILEKRYAKAEAFYLQARLLLPDYGNPFNQLAIVYSYQHDLFGAALNYYRALCVRRPFPTAKDNLIRTLTRCLEADREMWRTRKVKEGEDGEKGKGKAERGGEEEGSGPGDLESKFKHDVVLLHALWAGKLRLPKLARHTHNVLASFASLAARRLLPAATLVQVLVLSLGALWKVRMFRESDEKSNKRSSRDKGKGREKESEEGEISREARIVAHILALSTVLLELGTREIEEGVREAGNFTSGLENEAIPPERLAQRITGTFRRTLPALRIASKWIKSNVEYVQRHSPTQLDPLGPNVDAYLNSTHPDPTSFWLAWARFITQLSQAFPLDSLPEMAFTLEEDLDMRGFAPLKRSMSGDEPAGRNGREEEADGAKVHPNEEQLMRIGDLIVDAKFVVNVPGCPVIVAAEEYVFGLNQHEQEERLDRVYHDGKDEEDDDEEEELSHPDDDQATVSTRTEDDPVRLAMDAVLSEDEGDEEEEEEEEEILYPQIVQGDQFNLVIPQSHDSSGSSGPSWPPPTPSFLSSSPSTQKSELLVRHGSLSKSSGTTAQDLLDRVMSGVTGPGTPPFLSGQNASAAGSMLGPTPSFLNQNSSTSFDSTLNTAFASLSPFPAHPSFPSPVATLGSGQSPTFVQSSPFVHGQNPPFPSQIFPNQLSPFPSQRSPSSPFSASSPPSFALGRIPSDPSSFFPSHTRVTSLTGTASIWTPAPQEVPHSPHLGIPSRAGSMRANSISGGIGASSMSLSPNSLPGSNTWSLQEGSRASLDSRANSRPRTYTTPTEVPQW